MRGGQGAVPIAEQSMIEKIIGWGPAALWAAVLFLFSAWDSPGISLHSGADKLAHGGAYLIFGLSLAWGRMRTASEVPVVLVILVGVGYGALNEWYQTFVLGREVDFLDGFANAVGVLAGYGLFARFGHYSRGSGGAPDEGTRASSTTQS